MKNRKALYMCVGENFKDNAPIGDCGDIKSLQEWMRHLTHKDDEFLERFFDESYKDKDVAEYLYCGYGKRLKKI